MRRYFLTPSEKQIMTRFLKEGKKEKLTHDIRSDLIKCVPSIIEDLLLCNTFLEKTQTGSYKKTKVLAEKILNMTQSLSQF